MARRNHPNQANSGLWLPKKGDNFDRPILLAYLDFFEDDLQEAKDYRTWINKYAKMPSFKQMVARADADIKISQVNLNKCRDLLKNAVENFLFFDSFLLNNSRAVSGHLQTPKGMDS